MSFIHNHTERDFDFLSDEQIACLKTQHVVDSSEYEAFVQNVERLESQSVLILEQFGFGEITRFIALIIGWTVSEKAIYFRELSKKGSSSCTFRTLSYTEALPKINVSVCGKFDQSATLKEMIAVNDRKDLVTSLIEELSHDVFIEASKVVTQTEIVEESLRLKFIEIVAADWLMSKLTTKFNFKLENLDSDIFS